MSARIIAFPAIDPSADSLPLLDEEFDRAYMAEPAEHASPAFLGDDLAWDDQLDNGEEMSL